MADKYTLYNELKFVATFTDGDTRTITIESPNTEEDLGRKIKNLEARAANVLIGDKYGAPFSRFADARVIVGTRVDLDLETQS